MSLQAVASVINAVGAEAGVGAGACAEEGSEEREEEEEACRVLSIQSHVVSGCVGNKAAVFPLQVLGFEVDYVNSVQFSNHTGYPMGVKGTVLSGTELLSLLDGLSLNHLTHSYEYVLTGYIGSETFLDSVLRVLDKVKEDSPGMRYVCDPVLGDNHQYYVPQALVQIFREKLIPRAYMITPNQFEAELLTTTTIDSETAAVSALLALHSLGPQIVMLTSAEFPTDPGVLHCYVLFHNPLPTLQSGSGSGNGNVGGSGSDSGSGSGSVGGSGVLGSGLSDLCVSKVVIRKQAGHYTGTGDATAALMLAWVHSLKAAAASTSSTSAPIHHPPHTPQLPTPPRSESATAACARPSPPPASSSETGSQKPAPASSARTAFTRCTTPAGASCSTRTSQCSPTCTTREGLDSGT
eukprot:CAMPEP_0173221770 /NCGR_PEP_ID=MMETSP1142-20121109/2898_1 /TAXON_ID=483371 /ORGANISM="non described non described, Strain CCMP2298" /LENGTH=408 /DNA_ID=CAMNT_0014149823 /DNA_START=114 /DNA_END=1337 /DNA_ORIENTATION=+